jgi:hypothetical protein
MRHACRTRKIGPKFQLSRVAIVHGRTLATNKASKTRRSGQLGVNRFESDGSLHGRCHPLKRTFFINKGLSETVEVYVPEVF